MSTLRISSLPLRLAGKNSLSIRFTMPEDEGCEKEEEEDEEKKVEEERERESPRVGPAISAN